MGKHINIVYILVLALAVLFARDAFADADVSTNSTPANLYPNAMQQVTLTGGRLQTLGIGGGPVICTTRQFAELAPREGNEALLACADESGTSLTLVIDQVGHVLWNSYETDEGTSIELLYLGPASGYALRVTNDSAEHGWNTDILYWPAGAAGFHYVLRSNDESLEISTRRAPRGVIEVRLAACSGEFMWSNARRAFEPVRRRRFPAERACNGPSTAYESMYGEE